jgi:hypothetical protein
MTFLSGIANAFRSASKDQKPERADHYGILSPLLATGELLATTQDLVKLISTPTGSVAPTEVLKGRIKTTDKHVQKSVEAYQNYVKRLSPHEQQMERAQPLSSVVATTAAIRENLTQIEDNFQALFSGLNSDKPEQNIKSSSLVVIGYLQKADTFCTWVSTLVEHLTSDAGDMIPPFRTREMLNKASGAAEFASMNLGKWSPKRGGFLTEVKVMQSKGADVPLQTSTGQWIDEYAHTSQFSADEQDLMTASLGNVMLMIINWGHMRTQAHIELLSARKEWLTAKIIQLQSKSRGMDVDSGEYQRLKKATEKYASIVSKYEQQIERMRG